MILHITFFLKISMAPSILPLPFYTYKSLLKISYLPIRELLGNCSCPTAKLKVFRLLPYWIGAIIEIEMRVFSYLFKQACCDHAPNKRWILKDPNKFGKLLPLISHSNTFKFSEQTIVTNPLCRSAFSNSNYSWIGSHLLNSILSSGAVMYGRAYSRRRRARDVRRAAERAECLGQQGNRLGG